MDTYQIAGREATVLGQLEVGGLMIPILGVKELQDRVVTEEDLRFCTVGFKGALHDVHTGKREVAECPD